LHLAFRVEVSSLGGALSGVPKILELLKQYDIQASFILSLGPSYSDTPLMGVVSRTLLRGFSSSNIEKGAGDNLREIADSGHEVGVAPYDPGGWRTKAAYGDMNYTREAVEQSLGAFRRLFGRAPRLHGATGWQVNPHLFTLEQSFGFSYASDVRGKTLFFPSLQNATSLCLQIPTTLPTFDEMLKQDGVHEHNVDQYLFAESQRVLPHGEVFSLNADDVARGLLPALERLIVMWRGSQWEFHTFAGMVDGLDKSRLKRHYVGWTQVNGHDQHVAMQGLPLE
jgi:undecaprenyl phosphate-alpha-L-ara4FN deformylase